MDSHKKKASAKIGMLPGSAIYVGENPPIKTRILTHIYDNHSYKRIEGLSLPAIQDALTANQCVWIDVSGLADSPQISELCAEFTIHPLFVEDILNTHQRAKLDEIDGGFFIVFNLLHSATHRLSYNVEQFSMVVKKNLLLTFRESEHYNFHPIYTSLSAEHSLVREHGCDYLTHLLMDNIVDNYFNLVEEIEQALGNMEDLLIKNPQAISLSTLYTIKRHTMTLRKAITPLQDIVHLLLSEHGRFIDAKYRLYYRDLHDHCVRLLQSIDLQREMSSSILEIYLSTLNNRMNETMKVLTLFASLFIPLTFIAGIYGMNFVYMPELKWRYSYPLILGLMLVLAIIMLYYFKRKKLF